MTTIDNRYFLRMYMSRNVPTLYNKIASVEPHYAVVIGEQISQAFNMKRDDFIAQQYQKIQAEFDHYVKRERPVIFDLSRPPPGQQSEAAPLTIQILEQIQQFRRSLAARQINIKV